MPTRTYAADVLVAGGGMAGLCAALSALEQGAKVLVLEKGTRYGGSMALSNGLVWTFATEADARRHVPDGDPALQELLVGGLPPALEWLAARGVELEPEIPFLGYGRGRRASAPQMTAKLLDHIAALGGKTLCGVAMQNLQASGGAVSGVLAFDPEGAIEVEAKSVILATGGFQGNADLVARYITPQADAMYLRSNPWSTGDGLLAAQAVGATTTSRLHTFYGHAMSAPPARFNRFEFQAMSHKYGQMAVALDMQGRRFADESAGTGEELLNAHIARLPDATAVYVFDALTGERAYEGGPLARVVIDRARQAGAPVLQAPTLEALAAGMQGWGLPPAEVLQTLHAYNEAVRSGSGDALLPPRRAMQHAVDAPPFTAALLRASITFTCGGLFVDLDMRVLRRASSISSLPLLTADVSELQTAAIPNLYAAGSDAGGFSGRGYMGGLSQALVTGRTAGREASRP